MGEEEENEPVHTLSTAALVGAPNTPQTWPGWASISNTAASWLWGAGWGATPYMASNGKYYNLSVPGSSTVTWNGKTASMVELRGWLRPAGVNQDPDAEWDLDLDPDYLAAMGMDDPNVIMKVGNILNMQKESQNQGTFKRAVAIPTIHMELSGWRITDHPGQVPPSDWLRYDGYDSCPQGVAAPDPRCAVLWPYNPAQPLSSGPRLTDGLYVRVVGSVVTDEPHCTAGGDLGDAIRVWARRGCSKQVFDEGNSARWTELHSPDVIEALPDPGKNQVIRAVAVAAENGLFSGDTQRVDVDLYPSVPQPGPGYKLVVREFVGGETNLGTLTDGNPFLNGARITNLGNRVNVQVQVHGESGYGRPGKFKALYRLSWDNARKVAFRTWDGTHYLNAVGGGGGQVDGTATSSLNSAAFTLVDRGNGNVALRCASGYYATAENGGSCPYGGGGCQLTCNRTAIGGWETFALVDLGGGQVALRGMGGDYASAVNGGGGGVEVNRPVRGPWETFVLVDARRAPFGYLDSAGAGGISGWAVDPEEPTVSTQVHIYIDGAFAGAVTASNPRPDVNQATGLPGDHGFWLDLPPRYADGWSHSVVAYAIGVGTVGNPALSGSPATFLVCTGGLTDCGAGVCVDLSSDPGNCGVCGATCPYTCTAGTCDPPPPIY